ncbi:hypothetical protein BH11BAC4_BH11BAC4_14740 [soil metagenome]
MKFFFSMMLFLLGMMILILGLKFLYNMYQFKKTGIKTMATVINIKTASGRTVSKTYSPILSFTTITGTTRIYDVSAFYHKNYAIGQQIEIVYSKENTNRVMINSFRYIFMVPTFLIVLGLFIVGLSTWLFLKK